MEKINVLLITASFCFSTLFCTAQENAITDARKTQAMADLQMKYEDYRKTSLQIWHYSEVGYKEEKSTALLQNY